MFFKKKIETISRKTPGFEETERRTPKVGILLLILMFIAGMWFGEIAVQDLSLVPDAPPVLSNCSYRYLTANSAYASLSARSPFSGLTTIYNYYYDSGYGKECRFNDLEEKYGIPALIKNKRQPLDDAMKELSRLAQGDQAELSGVKNNLYNLERQYNLGLQETQAQLPQKTFPVTPEIQQKIINVRNEETRLQAALDQYDVQFKSLETKLKEVDKEIQGAYKPVFEEHNRRLRWHEFKVFLLQFAVTAPLFFLVFGQYLRLSRKNSPFTIIFTAMVGVTGLLLLQVILFWFWGLFLARIVAELLRLFQTFKFIRSLVFYSGMLISFLIFGGGVYYLQKKVFDPRRVILRRFRAKECPHCQTNLDLAYAFCPNCGEQIRMKCSACGQARFINLPTCPYCGAKK